MKDLCKRLSSVSITVPRKCDAQEVVGDVRVRGTVDRKP